MWLFHNSVLEAKKRPWIFIFLLLMEWCSLRVLQTKCICTCHSEQRLKSCHASGEMKLNWLKLWWYCKFIKILKILSTAWKFYTAASKWFLIGISIEGGLIYDIPLTYTLHVNWLNYIYYIYWEKGRVYFYFYVCNRKKANKNAPILVTRQTTEKNIQW